MPANILPFFEKRQPKKAQNFVNQEKKSRNMRQKIAFFTTIAPPHTVLFYTVSKGENHNGFSCFFFYWVEYFLTKTRYITR